MYKYTMIYYCKMNNASGSYRLDNCLVMYVGNGLAVLVLSPSVVAYNSLCKKDVNTFSDTRSNQWQSFAN